jgi:hypothetical protein
MSNQTELLALCSKFDELLQRQEELINVHFETYATKELPQHEEPMLAERSSPEQRVLSAQFITEKLIPTHLETIVGPLEKTNTELSQLLDQLEVQIPLLASEPMKQALTDWFALSKALFSDRGVQAAFIFKADTWDGTIPRLVIERGGEITGTTTPEQFTSELWQACSAIEQAVERIEKTIESRKKAAVLVVYWTKVNGRKTLSFAETMELREYAKSQTDLVADILTTEQSVWKQLYLSLTAECQKSSPELMSEIIELEDKQARLIALLPDLHRNAEAMKAHHHGSRIWWWLIAVIAALGLILLFSRQF